MRSFLLFSVASLAGLVGCGGSLAPDAFSSDAGGDTSVIADGGGTDSSVTSDAFGPPSDVVFHDTYPPPACALTSDPCFAQFAAIVQRAAACMAHPDTCSESGGTDAAGCGHRAPNPTGGSICSWPDGTTLVDDSTGGSATNATHDVCYKYFITNVSAGVYDVHIGFGATVGGPDGDWIEELTSPGKPSETIQIQCPDGTKSRTFTQAELAGCDVATVCCSANTPPTCM